jgi:hypothetical protein
MMVNLSIQTKTFRNKVELKHIWIIYNSNFSKKNELHDPNIYLREITVTWVNLKPRIINATNHIKKYINQWSV